MELNTAKWSRLPDLNGSASHSFNFGRSLQADNTYQSINTQNTGLNLTTSVPLFTGMQIPHSISLAKLNLKAAIEDLNKAKEDISIQVASAYLQVLFNEELAKVAHQQVSLSQEMLKQKEAYYQNGKAQKQNGAKRSRVWHKTNCLPFRPTTITNWPYSTSVSCWNCLLRMTSASFHLK